MAKARKRDAPGLGKSAKRVTTGEGFGERRWRHLRRRHPGASPFAAGPQQFAAMVLLLVLLPLVAIVDGSPASAAQRSFFSTSHVPFTHDAAQTTAIELGLQFQVATSGYATGVRFFKAPANTGTHTGYIKNNSQTVLGSIVFTDESATGWQTAYLASPIALTAGVDYYVSYMAPNGDYSYTTPYFDTYVNPPGMTVVQSVFSANSNANNADLGNFSSVNYWVDVLVDTNPAVPSTMAQTSYIWQNDDGANANSNTIQAAANTAITGVNRNERLDLRVQLQNSGSQVSEVNRFGLFYDRSDGYWTKVGQDDIPITGTGNCDDAVWTCASLDAGVTASGATSTAIAPDGTPWIAYVDSGTGQLRIARYSGAGGTGCSSAAWTCMVVDSGGAGVSIEPGISLTFTSAGIPWISYQRNNALAVANYSGTGGTGCTRADESTVESRWTCVAVDTTTGAGDTSAIAIDRDGKPWVAFDNASGGVNVANRVGSGGTCSSTAWSCTTAHTISGGTGVAADLAIAFSTDNQVLVSYHDQTAGDLWVARRIGSGGNCTSAAWDCTNVDSTGNVGAGTSVALAPDGSPAVSYLDNTSGAVKFTQFDGDGAVSGCASVAWTCSSVAAIGGTTAFTTSLAFAPDNNAWIGYSDASAGPAANDLRLARHDGDVAASGCSNAAWTCSTTQSTGTVGANVSLVFDATGQPWMSHNGGGALNISTVDRGGEINAASSSAGLHGAAITSAAAGACTTWRNGRISESGEVDKIFLNTGECTELGYGLQTTSARSNTTYRFVIASDTGPAAKSLWRGVGSTSNFPTLTTSSIAATRVSKDVAPQWSACTAATDWSCMEIEVASQVGRHTSAAVDPDGNPWLMFFNEDNQEMRLAQYVGTGGTGCDTGSTIWKCSSVDGDGSGENGASIAFDKSGNPILAYRRYQDDQVRVARYVGSGGSGCSSGGTRLVEWTCTVIANGTHTSIAVDPAGIPWVTWSDTGSPVDLHVARFVGSGGTGCFEASWSCELIDDAAATNNKLTLDASGNPWISYSVGNATRVARYVGLNGNCTNVAWECTLIDATGPAPAATAIAIDNQNRAWITTSRTGQNPRYAFFDGDGIASGCITGPVSWTCGEIAAGTFDGTATLAFDAYGRAWTAFQENSGAPDLWVAYYTGVTNGSCNVSGPWQCITPYTNDFGVGNYATVFFDKLGTPWVTHVEESGGGRDQQLSKLTLPPGPPSLRNTNIYNGRNATTGDGRYRLTWGDTARPMAGSCDGTSDGQGYCGVAVDDTSYDSMTAQASESPIFNFSVPVTDAAPLPTATWRGRSSIAASSKTLTMEIYKFGATNAWVSIDTDAACAANADCVLTGSATGTAADYYQAVGGDTYMYWRVRQESSAASVTALKTDHMQAPANTPPSAPTSLTQRKSDNSTAIATAGWTNENQVRMGGAVSDPDASDSLQLCIELKPAATAFDGVGESCASTVAYSGTPLMQSISATSLAEGTYHWRARTRDAVGANSAWVFYNGADATHFGVDTTAPTTTTIYDGTAEDVDALFNDGSLDELSANWDAFADAGSGVAGYEYSVGVTPGGTTIKTWTGIGAALDINPAAGLILRTSQTYYVNVRATDTAGNATIASSSGQVVAPTLSFTLSNPDVDMGTFLPNQLGSDTLSMTTSTNGYGGYEIRAELDQPLTGPMAATIPAFSAGTYNSPALWTGSDFGFGYTSSDTSIQGLGNHFGTATLFAPFATSAPGDIVADHTTTVGGTPIVNETFDLTIQLRAPLATVAGQYSTTLVLTATATY